MKRVLIIGSTGRIGRAVLTEFQPINTRLRALVRNPAGVYLPPDVEVSCGDLAVPQTLEKPLEDVDTVFLVWTAPPATIRSVLDLMLSRVRRIVFLSSPWQTRHPLFQAAQPNAISSIHAEIEGLIRASGIDWTFLRPGMFASNTKFWWAPQIRSGAATIRWPHAAALTAPIDDRDIAAVALRTLTEDGHEGREYVLTGPQSLTQSEQLSLIGEALGRRVDMQDISPDEARREWIPFFPSPVLEMLLKAWAAAIPQPALVTTAVEDITRNPARSFRQWALDHAADFRLR
jgi:uncharacterized protein YbjT (DUF2867 family)